MHYAIRTEFCRTQLPTGLAGWNARVDKESCTSDICVIYTHPRQAKFKFMLIFAVTKRNKVRAFFSKVLQ